VINDDIETAANQLTAIFVAAGLLLERQKETAQKILSGFTK
jgi:hypothetical protein